MKELTEDIAKVLLVILAVEKERPEEIPILYKDFGETFFAAKLIQKRIDVLNIPKMEPSAIMALAAICQVAGKAVLGMIDTYEKAEEIRQTRPVKIDAAFICQYVYPMGFYEDYEFGKIFDKRRETRSGKYDFII
jgi:hypothetical protein